MHLHAPPDSGGGGAKAVCRHICFHPLEVIKSDSTAAREVFYAAAEVEGGQTAAV